MTATTSEALTSLRRELSLRGWDKKATGRIITELLLHIAIALTGICVFAFAHGWIYRAAGLLLATFGSMGVGTNTHTSSHYATSNKRWVNEALTYFGYTTFLGLSSTFWWHKHVVLHHPAPNVVGVDSDADLMPWFATTSNDLQSSFGWRRFYYRHLQFWLFPFMVGLNNFNMLASGWQHLAGKLLRRNERKAAHWIDLGALGLHLALYIGVPLLFLPVSTVLSFYILRAILLGYAMYAILGPGHLPAEARRITPTVRQGADFFALQTEGTVSFRTGRLGRFLCSGLEYQIEHHMFPNISHVFYPQLSIVVRQFCAEHGLSYRSYSWGRALWKSWEVLLILPDVVEEGER